MKEKRTVAFIGLGLMGQPMAANLATGSVALRVYDADPVRMTKINGAVYPASSALEAVDGADAVIFMLPDGGIMQDVLLSPSAQGKNSLAELLGPGTLVIDMGSSDPYLTREVGAELAKKGLRMVDAPVSGGVSKARSGELAIMLGGSEADVADCGPLMRLMGGSFFHTGPLGSGQAMKALNNLVSAAGLLATVEALHIGGRFGLDPHRMVEVLNASTGRNNTTVNKARQHMLSGKYGSGFAMRLMVKDIGAALGIAQREAVEAPESHVCLKTWQSALSALGHGADHTEIHRWLTQSQNSL